MTRVDCFKAGTCTAKSMARLRNILNERDEVKEYVQETFARLENQFNPDALSSSKDDDSYAGEEPGMSYCPTVCEADNVIANTGINPIMFEEGIDTEAWMDVLYLHNLANGFKDVAEVSEIEKEKREDIEPNQPSNPHYRLMEVKHEKTGNVRKFYWNGTEGYETCDEDWDGENASEDQEEFKNQGKLEHKRKQKVAVQLLYKKLGESRKGMKLAAAQKKRGLYEDFKKEYQYCSKNLDMINALDEKIKQEKIKRRKDRLRTKLIILNNLGSNLTVEKAKKMINEKSLAYAEAVVNSELIKCKGNK